MKKQKITAKREESFLQKHFAGFLLFLIGIPFLLFLSPLIINTFLTSRHQTMYQETQRTVAKLPAVEDMYAFTKDYAIEENAQTEYPTLAVNTYNIYDDIKSHSPFPPCSEVVHDREWQRITRAGKGNKYLNVSIVKDTYWRIFWITRGVDFGDRYRTEIYGPFRYEPAGDPSVDAFNEQMKEYFWWAKTPFFGRYNRELQEKCKIQ